MLATIPDTLEQKNENFLRHYRELDADLKRLANNEPPIKQRTPVIHKALQNAIGRDCDHALVYEDKPVVYDFPVTLRLKQPVKEMGVGGYYKVGWIKDVPPIRWSAEYDTVLNGISKPAIDLVAPSFMGMFKIPGCWIAVSESKEVVSQLDDIYRKSIEERERTYEKEKQSVSVVVMLLE